MPNLTIMGKKIWFFIGGIVTGVILTLVTSFIIAKVMASDIYYYQTPISYENKQETSFEVFQVIGDCALANEYSGHNIFLGKTVMLIGDNISFYSNQVVKVINPQQIGTYSYETNGGMPMTVPVIEVKQ